MAAWKFVGGEIFAAFDEDEVNFQRFSYRFETVKKMVDAISGVEELEIKVTNGYRNPTFKITRGEINEDKIIDKLSQYGISLENDEKFQLLTKQIIFETESKLPQMITHNELGFVEIENTECFLADKLYTYGDQLELKSVCAVPEMQPRGTFKQYRRFLIKEISKFPKLALAFVLGVTAPVAYILKKYGAFYETLLWCFCGESSIGKTTSLLSMLSLFGNPQFLLSNLNTTGNALEAQVSAQSGFPFTADEATRSKIDFDVLIYSLSSGKGKRRCNGDGTLKELVNFSGAAFFSSEQPILDKCAQQGGEEARVLEFELDWFDGDAKKAEKFLRFFNTHYGVATAPLASLLLDTKIQRKIVRHFIKAQRELEKKVAVKDGVDKRIVQRLAIIAVSCWVLQKALKVDFHILGVVDLLVTIFEEKQTRICRTDGTERLLQLFIEDYIHNKEKYSTDADLRKSARHASFAYTPCVGSLRGTASKFQGRKCLWLPTDTFNEILNRQTTYGASTAKKKLCEKGYLQKFGNAYYRWYNFGATSANAYCVFLPDDNETQRSEVEDAVAPLLKISPPTMLVAGFISLTCQQHALVINAELAERLGVKTTKTLFLHVWGAQEFLLLSTQPSDNAVKLTFKKISDTFVSTDSEISTVIQATHLSVGRQSRLLFTDIKVTGKTPVANIYIDNPQGQWCGKIDANNPYKISDVFPNRIITNKKHSLLEGD